MGAYHEPKYAFGRIFMSKLISMISILDDTFDAYGTYDELKLFVEAVKRFEFLFKYFELLIYLLLDLKHSCPSGMAKWPLVSLFG